MAMSVGSEDDSGVMNEINTTPLVDVMLVLLIIFLITIPVVIQTAPVKLPQSNSIALTTKPENLVVSIDRQGNLYQGAIKIDDGKAGLLKLCGDMVKDAVAKGKPLPEVHIRGDKDAQYQYIGGVLITVQRCQVQKVGFISEPAGGLRF